MPEGTFLSPRGGGPGGGAAVVAGNTEVSQMTCNALLAALGACASAQATMNNVIFGDATYQYYETVCGGVGAGPGFDGWGPVQTHMTNTRMTDPEILELRYPVRLEEFSIRRGSGGAGQWRGGDGARRRIRFLRPMQAIVVASRRNVAPHGLMGGADGAPAGNGWSGWTAGWSRSPAMPAAPHSKWGMCWGWKRRAAAAGVRRREAIGDHAGGHTRPGPRRG
ncbi:hydantoinase B/oxoprolinase family protein [Siccirubricoccus deserti]